MSCEGCPSKGNCGKDQSTCGVQINPDNKIKNIITVMSGKGGVGKSTVTVMLAKALCKLGLKVGIMDADITGPSIPRLLQLNNEHAYGNEKQQLLPVESKEGIKVMSLNFLVASESDPVIWRGPVIGGVVKQFYSDVVWGELDVLLIDMPPGTGDVALTIMQSIPVNGVVMVSTPQPMVSMIVEKACHMCEKMNVKVLGIIENMAYLECPNCHEKIDFYKPEDIEALCNSTSIKLYGTLPMLDLIRDINEYESYSNDQKDKVNAYMVDIAKEVLEDLA